mmetsp:Transcript_5639/g.11804  ORF Transcript_5639/g.11804 Transcript_5639/m.11804 type:complete len:341 (-) Transcript_5639:7-1029(-)
MELLGGPAVIALCLAWAGLWLAFHRALGVTWPWRSAALISDAPGSDAPGRAAAEGGLQGFYRAKLRRMQGFCALSSAGGAVLLTRALLSEDPLRELLAAFGPSHQVLFCMAVGHWTVNMWEDGVTRSFLGQGLSRHTAGGLAFFPFNLCCEAKQVMLWVYWVHHFFSAFAYCYSLATHKLGGVMVQGLLFEVPVFLMLRRELGAARSERPIWMLDATSLRRHWGMTYAAFALGRGPAEILWVVSFGTQMGRQMMTDHVDDAGLVIYHLLALFFTGINVRVIGLLMCWHHQDVEIAAGFKAPPAGCNVMLAVPDPSALGKPQPSEDKLDSVGRENCPDVPC